jgi:hypothetical protein
MKKITLFLLLSTLYSFGDDFITLQQNYNKAVDKVVEPINKTYVFELQKLLEKSVKSGNLDEVASITEELKKFNIITSTSTSSSNIERFFVNKKWKTPFGTTFWFQKNGQGMKTTGNDTSPFTWRIIENNIVEYNGRVTSTEPIKTEYIRFLSKKEAYIGKSLDKINVTLTPVN